MSMQLGRPCCRGEHVRGFTSGVQRTVAIIEAAIKKHKDEYYGSAELNNSTKLRTLEEILAAVKGGG